MNICVLCVNISELIGANISELIVNICVFCVNISNLGESASELCANICLLGVKICALYIKSIPCEYL